MTKHVATTVVLLLTLFALPAIADANASGMSARDAQIATTTVLASSLAGDELPPVAPLYNLLDWMMGLVLAASAIFVGWLVTLRRVVRQRTRELQEELDRRERAESALRASEHKYRLLVDNLAQGIWHIDQDARTTFANPAMAAMLGYNAEEMAGRPLFDFMDARGVELATRYFEARKDGVTERHDFEFLRKDGSRIYTSIETGPLLDEKGDFTGAIAGVQDVTALRATTEALRHSEANLHTLIESTDDIIALRNRTGEVVVSNGSFARLYHALFDVDMAPGAQVATHLVDAERNRWDEILAEVHTGDAYHMDYAREIDDKMRYFAMSIYPVRSGGEIIGSSEFTREITDRVRAEESLRDSEARFRLAFENANVGVCLVGLDRQLLRVNERFCTMLGYERHELEGLTVDEITHPDYVAASTAFIQRVAAGDRDDIEKVYLHRDGRHVWGRVNRSLVRDGDGKPLYYIAHVQDITERKQAEAERERLQEQLLQAQKMEAIGRLAGGIAHDFNNMLAVILLRAEMSLPLTGESTPLHYNLSSIHGTAQRSADLVRQLLGFARKQVIAPKSLDLNATIEGMLPMLQSLVGEGIALTWHPAAGLWRVKMDPAQIDQILANLCSNARDAVEGAGAIKIETANVVVEEAMHDADGALPAGDYVAFSVTDDGCGIDDALLPHIFEPFFTTKEVGKGSGLGLATVEGIVHQNHGHIQLVTAPGQGATFKILLPRQVTESGGDSRQTGDLAGGKGETILVVEDEPTLLEMTAEALEFLGYKVLSAGSLADARRLMEEHGDALDLLVTDIVMPEVDGRQLARRLAELQPGLRVLFVSGYPADHATPRGTPDSDANFLQKPYSLHALAAKVREILDSAPVVEVTTRK